MRFRVSLLTIAWACTLANAGRADADVLPSPGACALTSAVAAFQMDGDAPVAIGQNGEIARFTPFTEATPGDPGRSKVVPPAAPPAIACTGIANVIGLAIDASGTMFVANERSVFRVPRGSGTIAASMPVVMTGDEMIRAIALTPNGSVEIAIGVRPDPKASTTRVMPIRFAVFAPALGASARAKRSFSCATLRGATDAISIDSGGRTYAATEGAQIAIFAPNATGVVRPAELLNPPLDGLRPSLPNALHGLRPLAFDVYGNLYAADDGSVVQFRFQQEAGTHITDGEAIVNGPRDGLQIVEGAATNELGRLFIVTVSRDTHRRSLVVFPGVFSGFGTRGREAAVDF